MTATLDIIIVNWNAGIALRQCLSSISECNLEGFTLHRVIVVDNASSDGSAKNLADMPLPLEIIQNSENRGFAAACNQGASGSAADFLLFLNPDTRLFQDTLSKSIAFMSQSEHASIGILGVQLIDDDGHVSQSCARFFKLRHFFNHMLGLHTLFPTLFQDGPMSEWDHLESRAVDHVIGAYFFLRNSTFKELFGFDERFFVYLEDIDFSLRAKRIGWQSYYLNRVQCYHRGGGTSQQVKSRRLFYSLQSRILYGFKNLGPFKGSILLCATLLLEPLSRISEATLRLAPARFLETIKGFWFLWRALPKILRLAIHERSREVRSASNLYVGRSDV